MTHVYLDSAATTRCLPEVIDAVSTVLDQSYGNPSSLHTKGLEAERIIKQSRHAVATALGANPTEIVFTSGGTEGNHLAIKGTARARGRRGKHVITTSIEHSSVLKAMEDLEADGFSVTRLAPQEDGIIRPQDVIGALRPDTVLVSFAAINNEIGSIQPIRTISRGIRAFNKDIVIHVDGVQAFLKAPLNPGQMGIDLLTISGHKIHAPKGSGALYVRRGLHISPLFGGGDQEGGLRSGTENVPGIAGMGTAVQRLAAAQAAYQAHLKNLKTLFLETVSLIDDMHINGPMTGGADHIVNLSFPGVRGEVLMHELSSRGVYVSTGSACSSKKGEVSHVLQALALPKERLESAIRVSFSYMLTQEDVLKGAQEIRHAVEKLRSEMRLYK